MPKPLRARLSVIRQSAPPLARPRQPSRRAVVVSVIGHLRDVKDPLRAAEAARLLPADSRILIEQVGRAYTPEWADQARAEMAINARYKWRDDVPAAAVRRLLSRSHAMVISSQSEGGANVVSEAVVAGVPVLASRIDGNVALLGSDYAGYFPVRDTRALCPPFAADRARTQLWRDARKSVPRGEPLFLPARERAAWRRLLADLR